MRIKLWKVEFGDNWSKQIVDAQNIEQAMRRARQIHVKETRENGWSKSTERLPITSAELFAESDRQIPKSVRAVNAR